ncbi:MAG: hypothetical protein ACRCY3_14665 [Sphingorhabdus sp.]
MNWRAGIALTTFGLLAGILAFSWLSSAGLTLWGESASINPIPDPAVPALVAPSATASPIPVVPQIVHPIADSARTEAMLVVMAARRRIESGVPLGDLTPRLNAAFGQSEREALAKINAAGDERLTIAELLKDFDAIAPDLRRNPAISWKSLRNEVSTLFVIRRSNTPPEPVDAHLQRARDYLVQGNVGAAMRFVTALPGAANARDWTAKAQRYVAAQQALDRLEHAALAFPPTISTPIPPV